MKNTKENVLKLLKAIKANQEHRYDINEKAGNTRTCDEIMVEIMTLRDVIWYFEDETFFNDMVAVFLDD